MRRRPGRCFPESQFCAHAAVLPIYSSVYLCTGPGHVQVKALTLRPRGGMRRRPGHGFPESQFYAHAAVPPAMRRAPLPTRRPELEGLPPNPPGGRGYPHGVTSEVTFLQGKGEWKHVKRRMVPKIDQHRVGSVPRPVPQVDEDIPKGQRQR